MNIVYRIGIVFGIVLIYSFITLFGAFLFCGLADDSDNLGFVSWSLGLLMFLGLAIFTLEKFNLWI